MKTLGKATIIRLFTAILLSSTIVTTAAYSAENPISDYDCLKTELFQEIRRQAKPLLQKTEIPDEKSCDGLTYEQLQMIDFTQINLDNYFKAHPIEDPACKEIKSRLLSERIQAALEKAIDDPTDENVQAWLNLQDEARKKAQKFADAVQRLSKADSVIKPMSKRKVMKSSKKHQVKVSKLMRQFNMSIYCTNIIGIEGYPHDPDCDRLNLGVTRR